MNAPIGVAIERYHYNYRIADVWNLRHPQCEGQNIQIIEALMI